LSLSSSVVNNNNAAVRGDLFWLVECFLGGDDGASGASGGESVGSVMILLLM